VVIAPTANVDAGTMANACRNRLRGFASSVINISVITQAALALQNMNLETRTAELETTSSTLTENRLFL